MTNKPLVVIFMVTYNHEKYVREAIESVISQQTNFPYLLMIGEDCSPDGTAAICSQFQQKYPDKIWLHLNEVNLGVKENARLIYNACAKSGAKYVTFLDGDDYWSDPRKLQKQVDFLERNTDYSMCFHRVHEWYHGTQRLSDLVPTERKDHYNILDLAKGNFMHSPSVMFPNITNDLPPWFSDSPAGDYTMFMLAARKGLIKYFPEPMAVYRIHEGGVWSLRSRQDILKRWNDVLKFLIMGDFSPEVKDELRKQKSRNNIEYSMLLLNQNRDLFLSEIDTLLAEDPGLAEKLIKGPVLNSMWENVNSRSFKLVMHFGRLKRRLLKYAQRH